MDVALCLFGSVARGNSDAFSDKDLLVVSDDYTSIPKEVKTSWSNEGWSPAYYNWQGLVRKAVKGDLFVQHLKQEGVIIDDPSGRLGQLLHDFSPKADYTDEISKSTIMLRAADRKPDNNWLSHMLCEVTCRFFRYAMLNALASRQLYIFDYAQSIDVFSDNIHEFTDGDKQMLQQIRAVQHGYKVRELTQLDTDTILTHIKSLLTEIFKFEFLDIPANSEARLLKPYSTLRDIEARILAYQDPIKMDDGQLLPDIWKLVQDPREQNWAMNGEVDQDVLDSINAAISQLDIAN